MRGKELNETKIIDMILKYGRLKLTGRNGDSIMEKFKSVNDEGEKNDTTSLHITEKTLRRQVSELCKDGLLTKDADGYYSINQSYWVTNKTLPESEWKKLLTDLIENNQLDTYRYVRNLVKSRRESVLLDDVQLKKYSQTIKESVHILSNNQETIQKINHALTENRLISVEYKGKKYTLYPICYTISRDGTRKYLYGIRRKRLLPPMNLNELHFKETLGRMDIDREPYRKQIQEAWDIDVQQPYRIKVLVRKNINDSYAVIRKISDYLGKPIEENQNYNIYEGDIIGINDFKTWLRSYVETCIVLQPDDLREEFINSLQEKVKRYGGIK